MNKLDSSKGFSMLELGIALTIIAMVVASVVAGSNIKKQLELNQVVEDISNISKAVKEFRETYGAYPGDMFDAEDKFGAANTDNGNGDDTLSPHPEPFLFWQHLALAGLIEGTYDGATEQMETTIKNGLYYADKANYTGGLGIISVGKGIGSGGNIIGLFTTKQAFDLDTKYDDGNPTTGNIQSTEGDGEGSTDCENSGAYTLSNTGETPCVMAFYIE